MAVQVLADPKGKAPSAAKGDLDQAIALARASAESDAKGGRMLAASNGFSRANQVEQAIPWAEKAVAQLESIPARLNLGDLLLTRSEAVRPTADQARQLQDRALAEYDKILAAQPDVIEAVNNKAWILHQLQGGRARGPSSWPRGCSSGSTPGNLPGEFYDTLGSIQEELRRPKDAEESYKKGLGKSPEHPVLNYHMGRLMAGRQVEGPQGRRLPPGRPGRQRPAPRRHGRPTSTSLLKQVPELSRRDRLPLRNGPAGPLSGGARPVLVRGRGDGRP